MFDDILEGRAPTLHYLVNGHQYNMGYYLTDGIYPKWASFIQSISLPQTPKQVLFAQRQEAVQKDVERAFGVLQARFAIVKNPARSWDKEKIGKTMRACIILHNMILEDERDGYTLCNVQQFDEGQGAGTPNVQPPSTLRIPSNLGNLIGVRNRLRDRQTHLQLKADLVENIWNKFGHEHY